MQVFLLYIKAENNPQTLQGNWPIKYKHINDILISHPDLKNIEHST